MRPGNQNTGGLKGTAAKGSVARCGASERWDRHSGSLRRPRRTGGVCALGKLHRLRSAGGRSRVDQAEAGGVGIAAQPGGGPMGALSALRASGGSRCVRLEGIVWGIRVSSQCLNESSKWMLPASEVTSWPAELGPGAPQGRGACEPSVPWGGRRGWRRGKGARGDVSIFGTEEWAGTKPGTRHQGSEERKAWSQRARRLSPPNSKRLVCTKEAHLCRLT